MVGWDGLGQKRDRTDLLSRGAWLEPLQIGHEESRPLPGADGEGTRAVRRPLCGVESAGPWLTDTHPRKRLRAGGDH